MKRALNRRTGSQVFLHMPFGLCLTGKLTKAGRDGYRLYPDHIPTGACGIQFRASDVVAVNQMTGDSFALTGADTRYLATIR